MQVLVVDTIICYIYTEYIYKSIKKPECNFPVDTQFYNILSYGVQEKHSINVRQGLYSSYTNLSKSIKLIKKLNIEVQMQKLSKDESNLSLYY